MKRATMVLAMIASGAAPVGAQTRVDNAELWLTPHRLVESFVVSNEGAESLQFTLENFDWDRAEDGANRFLPAGSTPSSCERAMEVFPRQLRIPAGGSQSVRVSLNADSLPARTCWSLVFVQAEQPSRQLGMAVRYITRVGVKVYYTPAQTVTLAEVEEFIQTPRRAAGDSMGVELMVRNNGTRPVTLAGSIEIRRPDNFMVTSTPAGPVPILPGAARRMRITLPTLLPGSYVALAVLNYGADEELAAQTPIVVP